ncbi:MAG TPA: tRNA (adenosine(37)-N6)-threonylcarbamoyltransferase complex transferase subunit TsaD, partial [Longimicrobiales bacterium]|nr:tRNA (adenosine(37)-N6)-threonylcarbamoyltransferase complex transferase subunit TsaD [Longimicrobiales bacterium]
MSATTPLVLGIETSCDETSVALLRGERELLGHVILSQDVHELYGGVVPELASRAHLRVMDEVVDGALDEAGVALEDVDLFAVTAGPGLIGALLVGVTWAKAAAWALERPVVGVHHMEAHLFAAGLDDAEAAPPFVALLVSGGHTLLLWVPEWGCYELLGETRDDAAGEAFDKVAKMLGLGYPGGPVIERAAARGD